MNKRVLMSVLIIAVAICLVAAATMAYFSDTETSSGNTFAAGTLDLKVADDNEGYGDGVTATWVMSNMMPGVSSVTNTMSLQNSGSIAADHLEIAFSHQIDEVTNPVESDTNPNSLPGDMAKWLEIISSTYNGVNLMTTLTDANGNGWLDLEDVTLSPNTDVGGPLDDLPAPLANNVGTRSFAMSLFFRPEATNDIQGDILITTVTFILNQHASQ